MQGCCKARDCLSGFAAASITTDHHDIMLSELRQQVLSDGEHRQASPVLLPLAPLPAAPPPLQAFSHFMRLSPLLLALLPDLRRNLCLHSKYMLIASA